MEEIKKINLINNNEIQSINKYISKLNEFTLNIIHSIIILYSIIYNLILLIKFIINIKIIKIE